MTNIYGNQVNVNIKTPIPENISKIAKLAASGSGIALVISFVFFVSMLFLYVKYRFLSSGLLSFN